MNTTTLLLKLEKIIKVKNVPSFNYLKEGINEEILSLFFLQNYPHCNIPLEIIDIYKWRNGTETNNNNDFVRLFYLFPNVFLCTLEEVKILIDEDTFYNFKENNLFPLFSSGHGENIAFDLLHGNLIFCSTAYFQFDNFTAIYDSLSTMFESIIQCYESDIYYLDGENMLFSDYDKENKVSSIKNPKADYWKILLES